MGETTDNQTLQFLSVFSRYKRLSRIAINIQKKIALRQSFFCMFGVLQFSSSKPKPATSVVGREKTMAPAAVPGPALCRISRMISDF